MADPPDEPTGPQDPLPPAEEGAEPEEPADWGPVGSSLPEEGQTPEQLAGEPPSARPALVITPDMLADEEPADPRADFERGMSYAPRAVIALIVANTLVFAWELATGALADQHSIIAAGALARANVLRGEAWRLLSAMFLHGGGDHLVGNCIVLYIVGMACEHALGLKRAAVVYFVSGLCGSILSVAMSPGPSVGASGAIFGLIGSVIVFLYKHQNAFYLRDKRIGFVLLIWAIYQIAGGFLTPFIDNHAHIGGFVGGAVVTLFLEPVLLGRARGPAAR